jgi:hypothetical protein
MDKLASAATLADLNQYSTILSSLQNAFTATQYTNMKNAIKNKMLFLQPSKLLNSQISQNNSNLLSLASKNKFSPVSFLQAINVENVSSNADPSYVNMCLFLSGLSTLITIYTSFYPNAPKNSSGTPPSFDSSGNIITILPFTPGKDSLTNSSIPILIVFGSLVSNLLGNSANSNLIKTISNLDYLLSGVSNGNYFVMPKYNTNFNTTSSLTNVLNCGYTDIFSVCLINLITSTLSLFANIIANPGPSSDAVLVNFNASVDASNIQLLINKNLALSLQSISIFNM